MKILITGGAGFVGANLAIKLKKKYPSLEIVALDNLKRRGSELNLSRLRQNDIGFIHVDIRNREDFREVGKFDLMIECSAESSVLAGVNSSPSYLLNTNLVGTINCLEEVRKNKAKIIFLSTSRVYPIKPIENLAFEEHQTRFNLIEEKPGVSQEGISENFDLKGARSLYGATKLCSEYLIQEYIDTYDIGGIINRCGVITGPWQMGKVDQGVIVLWVARHIFGKKLSYIGYGGSGKQVRDFIHIDDLFDLIDIQIRDFEKFNNKIFNVGGGMKNSISLNELTKVCEEVTGNKIKISSDLQNRKGDVRWFVTDSKKIQDLAEWFPKKGIKETVRDIYSWIKENEKDLKPILN